MSHAQEMGLYAYTSCLSQVVICLMALHCYMILIYLPSTLVLNLLCVLPTASQDEVCSSPALGNYDVKSTGCNLIHYLWDINDVCHMSLLRYYVTFDGVLTQQEVNHTLNAVCSEVTEERLLCASQWTSVCNNRDTLVGYAAVNAICTDDRPTQYAQQLVTSMPPRVNATCMWEKVAAAIRACTELIAWRAAFGYNDSMTEAEIFQHHQTQMNNGMLCMYSSGESMMARCVEGEEVEEVEGLKAAYLLALLAYAPPGFIYNITYITDVTDRH